MMKSKKTYLTMLLAIFCGLSVFGCGLLDQDSRVLETGPYAAFKFQSDQVDAAADTLEPYNIALEVHILRPEGKLEQELAVSYIVIDSLTNATSADDYTFVTPSPVTVPADCLRTNLIIEIDGRTIPDGEARVLTIQLTGNESRGVKGAEEIGEFELTIVGN